MLDTRSFDEEMVIGQQSALLGLQMNLEDRFTQIALNEQEETQRPTLIICDRGILDGSAYCTADMWDQILDEQNMTAQHLIEKRYDAILHMVTAADGAEQFYDLSNEARYETPEGARAVDMHLRKVYLGHRKHMVVDNSVDFEQKVTQAIDLISSVIGLPTEQKIFKKFLVTNNVPIEIPSDVHQEEMTILENYIQVSDRNSD